MDIYFSCYLKYSSNVSFRFFKYTSSFITHHSSLSLFFDHSPYFFRKVVEEFLRFEYTLKPLILLVYDTGVESFPIIEIYEIGKGQLEVFIKLNLISFIILFT